MLRSIDFELPVTAGVTEILLPAIAWYDIADLPASAYEPGEHGIEIRRVVVHVNDEDIDINWTEHQWVYDLIEHIYGRMAA